MCSGLCERLVHVGMVMVVLVGVSGEGVARSAEGRDSGLVRLCSMQCLPIPTIIVSPAQFCCG